MQIDQVLLLCVLRWKIGQKSDALRVHKTHMDAGSMFIRLWPHVTLKRLHFAGRQEFLLHPLPLLPGWKVEHEGGFLKQILVAEWL